MGQCIGTVGLLLDMVGVVFVGLLSDQPGIYQMKEVFDEEDGETVFTDVAPSATKVLFWRIGWSLLGLGFFAQGIAQWIPSE